MLVPVRSLTRPPGLFRGVSNAVFGAGWGCAGRPCGLGRRSDGVGGVATPTCALLFVLVPVPGWGQVPTLIDPGSALGGTGSGLGEERLGWVRERARGGAGEELYVPGGSSTALGVLSLAVRLVAHASSRNRLRGGTVGAARIVLEGRLSREGRELLLDGLYLAEEVCALLVLPLDEVGFGRYVRLTIEPVAEPGGGE